MREEGLQSRVAPAFAGRHEPKPLRTGAERLRGLSERLLRAHWENDYCAAVEALNAIELRLAAMVDDAEAPPHVYAELKLEELLRASAVRLHELYFENLGGDGKADGAIEGVLATAFGSFSTWEREFRRTANALAGRSGWVILAVDALGDLHDYWAWDHAHGAPGSRPLLVLDMYEHAYRLDYGAAAARYVDAFLRNVDWAVVSERLGARGAGRYDTPATTSTPG